MGEIRRLTNSEMKLWRRCKRQWWLSHHRGLVSRRVEFNRPLSIGTRVHDALAAYYDPFARIDPLQHMADTVSLDVATYPAYEADIRKEAKLCEIMLEGYLQWCEETGADVGMELISAEGADEYPLPLPDGAPWADLRLLTKIDAQVRTPDELRLALEHKTVGSLTIALPTLQMDTQCLTEHLVIHLKLNAEGREDERADGVLYNMLRKVKRTAAAKPPFYDRKPVRHNVSELRNHWFHVTAIAAEIADAENRLAAGESHHTVCPPNPTKDDSWQNPFFNIFPLFDDGSDVESAIEELYVVRDPLERYADLLNDPED